MVFHPFIIFQLDFEIFRTIASFIKIYSGHVLVIKVIFIKFFRTIWEIGGQINVLRIVPSHITDLRKIGFKVQILVIVRIQH